MKPYESPAGFHRHCCEVCGAIWEHSDALRQVAEAHTCPKCGMLDMDGWCKYKGPKAPTVIHPYPDPEKPCDERPLSSRTKQPPE